MDKNRKNNSEYNLSVGQFAKLCNTTRDTLRHYYEIGILLPRIDENNSYHYYASSQISSFYFITSMQKAGCSLKEISDLIHDSTKGKIQSVVHEKIDEMKAELKNIQQKINTLNTSLWLLDSFEDNKNKPPHLETLENVSLFISPVTSQGKATQTSEIATDLTHHLVRVKKTADVSSFPMGVTISADNLMKGVYSYNNIISFSQKDADNVNTFALPSNKVVLCCHDHTKNDISDTYREIVSFIEREKLVICSDLHIISLINIYEVEEKHTYFKYLFICVE